MMYPNNFPKTPTSPPPEPTPPPSPHIHAAPAPMDKNLADFYLTRLSSIAAEEIVLDIGQVNSVIGVAACESISKYIVTMNTDLMGKRKKARSAIPMHKRVAVSGLGKFNRLELIAAIQSALLTPSPRETR